MQQVMAPTEGKKKALEDRSLKESMKMNATEAVKVLDESKGSKKHAEEGVDYEYDEESYDEEEEAQAEGGENKNTNENLIEQ